jgi:hypothetical protein
MTIGERDTPLPTVLGIHPASVGKGTRGLLKGDRVLLNDAGMA